MKFSISPKVLENFPDAFEYVVIAKGINNEIAGKWINDRLEKVYKKLRKEPELLESPKYKKWLDLYDTILEKVSIKEAKPVPAHVALTKRVLSGSDLPNINPLVNFYNLYSIEYGVPIGGEDLSQVYGDMELRYADEAEKVLLMGDSEITDTANGEIVWIDDHSVTCRMWNWRQSERTKVTKHSEDIYFIFDGFKSLDIDFPSIIENFCEEIQSEFGGSTKVQKLDKSNPTVEFEYSTRDTSDIESVEEDLKKFISVNKKKTAAKKRFMKRKLEPIGLKDDSQLLPSIENILSDTLSNSGYKDEISLEVPTNPKFGDLASSIAMQLAPTLKKAPQAIAEDLKKIILDNEEIKRIFSEVKVAPNGFLNFFFADDFLVDRLEQAFINIDDFGKSVIGEGKNILIESPSINPNAPAHVGHLLNLFLGRALARLFREMGFEVNIDNLINDRGIKICQAMWGIKNLAEGRTPQEEGLKGDHFVGKYYALAIKEYKENEEAQKEMDQMLRDWEDGKDEVMELWKKVVDWAFEGHLETFKRLNEERGHLWLESELYKGGKEIVMNKMEKGVIEELPDGAVVGRLEEDYGVDDVILLRSDGTSLYHTQDIFLTLQKIEKFNPWKAIWVVGNEQIAHFQKLFALLDKLEILSMDNLYHFPTAMVVNADGSKISSRKGEDVTGDGFLDMMHEEALKVIEEREIDVELKDKHEVAETVGIGALRYVFLSRDPYKDIKFDTEQSLSFTGRSGPYIMYAYSRGRSVLRKVEQKDGEIELIKIDLDDTDFSDIDKNLVKKILMYPQIILDAANNFAPSILADYLYELASLFNNFYENESVMDAKGSTRDLRILLTQMSTQTIKKGLNILGIDVLERM
jgi:arginyl-tRNA synthetase